MTNTTAAPHAERGIHLVRHTQKRTYAEKLGQHDIIDENRPDYDCKNIPSVLVFNP